MSRNGYPRKKDNILKVFNVFLKTTHDPIPSSITDQVGGKKAFLKRHPNIVERTSEVVSGASYFVSEKYIRK